VCCSRQGLRSGSIRSVTERSSKYERHPSSYGLDLIDQNRSALAAMPGEIALAVTVDIQPPNQASVLDRILPHARVHGLTAPGNVTRKSNIY